MKQANKNKLKLMDIGATTLNVFNGFPFSNFYAGIGHILMFHRVVPKIGHNRIWSNSFLEVSIEYFEFVIDYYIKNQYKFVTLDELLAIMNVKEKPHQKVVHLTFDDGYKDNLYSALPILKKHNIPATVYITNSFPNKKATLWWYDLETYILSHSKVVFSFRGKQYNLTTLTKIEKEKAFDVMHHIIQNELGGTIESRLDALFNQLFIDKYKSCNALAMSWEELAILSQEPLITIGGHTLMHNNLGQLPSDEIEHEIVESRHELSDKLKIKIDHFAYPFGGMDQVSQEAIKVLKDNGFKSAVTTFSGNVFMSHINHLLQLPRIAVGMSMNKSTLDLIKHGVIPFVRNKGKRIILKK